MADLSTTYLGLKLANPVIVSSSGITGSVDGIRKCADNGAGAVVLKSLFEEIIVAQNRQLERDLLQSEHPEAFEYLEADIGLQMGTKPYLKFIADARKAVHIPIIASVNCTTSSKWWISYAKDLESAGAHAIELNISHFPQRNGGNQDESVRAERVEARYADIVREVTGTVTIPVAAKIGCHFTVLYDVLKNIAEAGANGIVLFNRPYAVDVDLIQKRFIPSVAFSAPQEMALPLRWVGLASGTLTCDIAGATGIHNAEGALKMIMAGAAAVQVCSTLYLNGVGYLREIIGGIDAWLVENRYQSLEDIRGIARRETPEKEMLLQRLQYIKALNEAAEYRY